MHDFFKRENDYQASEVRRMQAEFENGALSRRGFLQGMLATGLALTSATAILSASRDVMAETPNRGGRVRVAWDQHGPADTLDPALFTSTVDYSRGRTHCNNLVQFQDDMSLGPDLAESWEINADATEFTFHLRKGVTFHDGKDLSADDVVYSMNRHLGEGSTSKASSLVTMIKEWKKLDSHTVQAVLETPNADLPAILGTFHFKILQDGADEKEGYFSKVIGTGPFMVEEFSPGIRTLSKRNPNYFREGRPYVDELEVFGITDNVSRVNALISGDIQLMGNLDAKAIKQVEAAPAADVFSVESGAYTEIVAMLDRHPGNNPDFVLALKYLCRRERMVRTVIKGQGVVGNDHPVGPSYAMHCAGLPQREFDQDKAKFHLQRSGITSAEVVTAEIGAGAVDLCLLVQAEAKKIGLDLNVKRVAPDGYWGNVWMKTSLAVSSWNMRPTANVMMTLAFHSEAPWNESAYRNPRLDQLLLETRAETDEGKRKDMFCEAQQLISDEADNIIPYHRNYLDAKASNLHGMPRVPLAAFGGAEFPEYIWLA